MKQREGGVNGLVRNVMLRGTNRLEANATLDEQFVPSTRRETNEDKLDRLIGDENAESKKKK